MEGTTTVSALITILEVLALIAYGVGCDNRPSNSKIQIQALPQRGDKPAERLRNRVPNISLPHRFEGRLDVCVEYHAISLDKTSMNVFVNPIMYG